jgi:hypothetical protein
MLDLRVDFSTVSACSFATWRGRTCVRPAHDGQYSEAYHDSTCGLSTVPDPGCAICVESHKLTAAHLEHAIALGLILYDKHLECTQQQKTIKCTTHDSRQRLDQEEVLMVQCIHECLPFAHMAEQTNICQG